MSSLTVEEDQKWVPTHVQVTVLRGRGLRGKGKHGTSDVYTIIQLGKEKYSTCVVEKTTEPEWREECSFELQPGVLESGGRSSCSAASNELILIVMHRALIGMDVFLGQAVIQLDKVFHETRCVKNEWYKLNSKTGKKEKERGDIQITVQFTRNNLTASMYDLVMKDKSASTFGKLKERMKGKRRSSDEDSASAIVSSGTASLYRMRHRLPSDGGGEEDYEDDEGGEVRRSKMRTFFLRGKLRKSSDTRSSTSLGSESSESSSRGGSLSPTAGISVVVSDLSNSPSNSSNLTVDNSPEHTANVSPKSSSLQCEFGDDEAGEITIAVPQPAVYVNGSHAYSVQPLDPGSGKPKDSLGLGLLQKTLPLSTSLQNLRPSSDLPKGPTGDGRRWSFDRPGEEEKAAIAAALEQSGPMQGDEEERAAPPKAASSSSTSTVESESQGKKQRRNLFSHGKSESAGKGQSKDESEQATAAEEKHRGWFGSKDSHSKPSLVVSPKLEPSTDPHPPPLPRCHHPPGPPLVSPLHHTNPFCPSQTSPPPISPCNPFFSLLQQHNPFYDDSLTAQPLKPLLPPLPYLSSARPPITQLFPNHPNHNNPTTEGSLSGAKSEAVKRPLPPIPPKEEKPLSRKLPNPFMSAGEPDSEWDEWFEAFAAGRLQSPEDLTTDCKTQQNTPSDHAPQYCNNKGALPPKTHQNTNEAQPCTEFMFEGHKATHHLDTFAQFLETIPEHTSFENFNTPSNSPKPDACTETNEANSPTNTDDLTDTNMHQAPAHTSTAKLNSSSPDPGSSGLGSSAEEDFLSCLSSYSDKFSASSSEEAEAHNFEIFGFDSSVAKKLKPSESEDDVTESNDLSSVEAAQHTVIQHEEGDEEGDPVIAARETGSEDAVTQSTNFSNIDLLPKLSELQPNVSLQPDTENKEDSEDLLVLNVSSEPVRNTTDVTTAEDEFCSTHPSVHIITSSPDVTQSSSLLESTSFGAQDAIQRSPIPFGLFGDFLSTSHIANSPDQDFDDTLLHTCVSDQSSFFQSLYVSTDSQDYQTCESHPSTKCSDRSEPNETLHSANSTICGELSESQRTEEDPTSVCETCNEEINQSERSICGAKDKTSQEQVATQSADFSNAELIPKLQQNSNISLQPDAEIKEHFFKVLNDSSEPVRNSTDVTTSTTQKDELCSALSSVHIITSSPDVAQSSSMQDVGDTLLHTGTSDQSSIFQSLYVSTESQEYQTCKSLPSSKCSGGSEPNETLHSENSTLGSELSREDLTNASTPSNKKIDQSEGSICGVEDKTSREQVFTQSLDFSNTNVSLQPDSENKEDFSKVLNDSSVTVRNTSDVMMSTNPKNELRSKHPSAHIITSCPDVTQSSSDSPIESLRGQDASQPPPVPFGLFGEFLNTGNTALSPGQDCDDALRHTCVLRRSQKTEEDPISACKPRNNEINQSEGSVCGAEDETVTPEPSFLIDNNFGLPPAASDSHVSCNQRKLSEGGAENQHVASSNPLAQTAPRHRSHSEGTLAPDFDELLLPSFGSDPGTIQESSSAPPGPDLPSLTSFAPSLTPQSSCSPVALCSLPPSADASTKSPSSVARAAPPPLQETQQQQAANQQNSPHPVKPLTTAMLAEEKRTEGRSVLATGLEKLKSTIHPGRSSQLSEPETDRKKSGTEGAGSYYHLNHSELVALLVQREAELERQKAEFERQRLLLAKREVELKKLKPQVKDLEDYIDTLLVRIMEQKPTLLQVRSKLK